MIKYTIYTVLFVVLLSLWGFYLALRPFKFTSNTTPREMGVEYEDVSFRTSDNVVIKGWYIPSKKPNAKTIILLHGYPADKGDIMPSRIFLHKSYNLLFIDFRFLGESGGRYSTVGHYEVRDVRAAIDYLKKRGVKQVGIWGLSMGGATALLTLKDAPEIKAIVAEAPYAKLEMMANRHYPIPGLNYIIGQLFRLWGLAFLQVDIRTVQPVKVAENIKIPLLMFYSQKDKVISFEHAIAMHNATKNNPNVEIIVEKDKLHGQTPDNYQALISSFFERNLH